MAERHSYDNVAGWLDSFMELALRLERERRDAEQYAALGSTSELDVPITGAGHSDPTGQRAINPDAYAKACERILHSIEMWLSRGYHRFAYDRDPAKEADPHRRRTMREEDSGDEEAESA